MRRFRRIWGTLAGLTLAASVATAGEVSNQQLAETLASAIAKSVPDQGYSVDVVVAHGVATLRGTAQSPAQLDAILQAAESVAGVRINNQIVTTSVQSVAYQVEGPVELSASEMPAQSAMGEPAPQHIFAARGGVQYDSPYMPPISWPSYAPYPNITAVQYPRCYPKEAYPHIGPFHPYPEPPLDWRRVTLLYKGGHWWLRFPQPSYLFRSIRYFY